MQGKESGKIDAAQNSQPQIMKTATRIANPVRTAGDPADVYR